MDPQQKKQIHNHDTQIIINRKLSSVMVTEPYNFQQNIDKNNKNFERVLQQIKKALNQKNEEQESPKTHGIKQLNWKWANKLTEKQILQLLQCLPFDLTNLCLNGTLNVTVDILLAIADKFQALQSLNMHYQPSTYNGNQQPNENWDLQFHVQIKSSSKKYRQCQKWGKLKDNKQNIQRLPKFIQKLPANLTTIKLRNMPVGRVKNYLKILFQSCPNIINLDLSQTMTTDENLQIFKSENFQKNIRKIQCLKLNCNRISRKALQCLFPHWFDEKQREVQFKNEYQLRLLDISQTQIANAYQQITKNLNKIEFLGLNQLQIVNEQILKTCISINKSNLFQLAISYTSLTKQSIQFLLNSNPNLQSLTLSNIEVTSKISNSANITFEKVPHMRRLDLCYNGHIRGQACIKDIMRLNQLQVLKISGIKIGSRELRVLGQSGGKLEWLEISHLQEVGSQTNANSQSIDTYNLFMEILQSLPRLIYIQAFNLLNKEQTVKFKSVQHLQMKNQQVQPNKDKQKRQFETIAVVLDSEGPKIVNKIR